MQAVVLAGGLGTRLWPLTREVPKPMVPVAGVPYLEHQLRLLRHQSITNIIILAGYLGRQIQDHFKDGSSFGLSIRYSHEHTPLGTGGALREAGSLLTDRFLLIYGDSYLPIDYRPVLLKLESSPAVGILVAYDNGLTDTSVSNNIAIDIDGYVSCYEKDSADRAGLKYVDAGVLAFRCAVLDLIPKAGNVSLEKEIFPKLIASHKLLAMTTRQRFYDIGTPARLQGIENFLKNADNTNSLPY